MIYNSGGIEMNATTITKLKPGETAIDYLMRNSQKLQQYLQDNGMYEAKDILRNILVGLKTTEQSFGYGFVIISGCGGSGKTKVAKLMLQFLKEELGTEYKLIATDENTSTDSLLCRISADSLMSTTGEKLVMGEMATALQQGQHMLWDELNRTPFENIQKLMTLMSESSVEHRGMNFKIPDGTIILSTANLGSKGTFPLAQEFKQRAAIVEVKYNEGEMRRICYSIFTRDAMKVDLGMALYLKTVAYAKEGRNGWNYEASVRTVKNFVDRVMISMSFGLDMKESAYQAIRSVLVQFTDENSVFIQRKNQEIHAEILPDIEKIIQQYTNGGAAATAPTPTPVKAAMQ
jgi:energy-coupling factor transporter ATP-binding protein EcfA2